MAKPASLRAIKPAPFAQLRTIIERYYRPPHRSRTSYRFALKVLDVLENELGIRSCGELTTGLIARFERATEPRIESEKRYIRIIFAAVCRLAADHGLIDVSPFDGPEGPRLPSGRKGGHDSSPRSRVITSLEIHEFCSRWLASLATSRNKASLVNVRKLLKNLVEVPGVLSTADLTVETVGRLVEAWSECKPSTKGARLAILNQACTFAVAEGYLASSPFVLRTGRTPSERNPIPDPDVVARLLNLLAAEAAQWEKHRFYALTATIVFTGLRRKEAISLKVTDIDLDERSVRTDRRSPIPIPEELASILSRWLPLAGSTWAFPNRKGTGPWSGGFGAWDDPRQGVNSPAPTYHIRANGERVGFEGLTFEGLAYFHKSHAAPLTNAIPSLSAIWSPPALDSVEDLCIGGPEVRGRRPPPAVREGRPDQCPGPVTLRGLDERPIVHGRLAPKLSANQLDVLRTIRDNQAPHKLTRGALRTLSGHNDADGILRRLIQSAPIWGKAIGWPEGGLGFRFLPPERRA